MTVSSAANSFDTFKNEVDRFGQLLVDMKVEAQGYRVCALLLASQCQDFSIGLLSLKDSLVLSSRLTLLRGLHEATMRLNYIAIEGEEGALSLECTDLRAKVSKFKLAQKNHKQLECSQIAGEEKRLAELKCDGRKNVKFSDVLAKIVEKEDSSDYWMYRYLSGFAHSELFDLSRHAVKSNSETTLVTSLICSPKELAEIYEYGSSMLMRAGNCLSQVFKIGSQHASQ